MAYVDPKNKVKEGTENGNEIDDLLSDLGISFDDIEKEKVKSDRLRENVDREQVAKQQEEIEKLAN